MPNSQVVQAPSFMATNGWRFGGVQPGTHDPTSLNACAVLQDSGQVSGDSLEFHKHFEHGNPDASALVKDLELLVQTETYLDTGSSKDGHNWSGSWLH